jgi:hypothetical protein
MQAAAREAEAWGSGGREIGKFRQELALAEGTSISWGAS